MTERNVGLCWIVVLESTSQIIHAAYSMHEARALCPVGGVVKNIHTGAVVARRAA